MNKKAIKCPHCKKSIRGTSGIYIESYRAMMYFTHIKIQHGIGDIIIT